MAKPNGGGAPHNPSGTESTAIVAAIVIAIACWVVWSQARHGVVFPLFGLAWVEYYVLDRIGHLDDLGHGWMEYVTAVLDGRRDVYTVEWQDLMDVLSDVGDRCALALAIMTGLMGAVTALRMRGDGVRRPFTLTGQNQSTVHRFLGWSGAHGVLSFLSNTSIFLPTRWLYEILKKTGLATAKKEWVPKGVSLAHYQAQVWKTNLPSANFNPNIPNPNEDPPKTPMEWMRDNNIKLTKRDGLDTEAVVEALKAQVGPTWSGVENAQPHVQAMAIMAAMNAKQDKRLGDFRDKLNEIYVGKSLKAAEIELRKLIAPFLADKKMMDRINKRASKHAFTNTAMIGLIGWGGPFKDWGGGDASVLSSSMYRWLKKVDRTLWYCLNNVGRRAFHIEGAGAICHFFAERVSGQLRTDIYCERAAEGLEIYLSEQAVFDLDSYFYREED